MTQTNYQTIFEIGLRSFAWGALFHPTIFIVIGLLLVRFSKGRAYFQFVGGAGALFGGLIFLLAAIVMVPEFIDARHAYVKGDTSIIQGTVENFRPTHALGPSEESFSVKGVKFSYYIGDSTPCFHNDPRFKGPLHAGLDVRIYYKDACIQRVDVRQRGL